MSDKGSQERTEQPTPMRMRKLRKQGSVAKSRDLVSAVVLAGLLMPFCIAWPWYLDQFKEIVSTPFHFLDQPFRGAAAAVAGAIAVKGVLILGPLLLIAVMLAVVTHLVQIGVIFSVQPILPKMERLNPAAGLKRLFSLPHLIETAKAAVKTSVLGLALFYLLQGTLQSLVTLPFFGMDGVLLMTVKLMQQLFAVSIIVALLMALVDVIVQKWVFLRENRMSKSDVKRDYKEQEGDPLIKSKRKFLYSTINMRKKG